MAELYTYDSTHLTTIRDGTVSLTQMAFAGQVGSGSFAIDDTGGALAIVGQKDVLVTQSSCANTRTFRGYVDDRNYGRDAGEERAPHVGAGRGIAVSLVDLNAMLGFRLINHKNPALSVAAGGKRPAETVAERGAWLMASPFMSDIADNGRCDFPDDKGMDAADYRYRFPGDVLADMAIAAGGYNYHVQDYGSGPELIFRNENASTADSSTLRISNVATDVDSWHDTLGATKTFAPSVDATLTRKPGRVISKIGYNYAKGNVVEERTATASAFNGERGGTASDSNIKSSSKASDVAIRELAQLRTEEDIIECAIEVPASAVNLLYAGWRVQAKFSHLATEGYGSFTWFRVIERTVKPLVAEGSIYEIRLRLSPQEAGEPVGAIVQTSFGFWGTGGSGFTPYHHLANPPSIGNTLLVMISKRAGSPGTGQVNAPNTDASRPRWGAGGWTELPLDIGGFTSTYVERVGGDTVRHGISMFWKEVDSTDQDGVVLNDYENVGVYEISGVDFSSATVVRMNNQLAATTWDVGTLGTVASGELAFMIVHTVPDDAISVPAITPAAGWVEDYYHSNYPIWYASTYPIVWMGHAIGAGATVDPSLVYPGSGRRWCGLAVKVGP